jgi:putative Mg2+ transporter-C (MgtC) family protein
MRSSRPDHDRRCRYRVQPGRTRSCSRVSHHDIGRLGRFRRDDPNQYIATARGQDSGILRCHGSDALPLGILTGVGFIGGGTILKKGDLVAGVTTAATIWVMTVIGLCLGGGQLALGIATTALAIITLWLLKWIDLAIPREHRAVMVVTADNGWSPMSDLPALIAPLKCRAHFRQRKASLDPAKAEFCFEVSWRLPEQSVPPLELLRRVSEHYPVISFELTSENGR